MSTLGGNIISINGMFFFSKRELQNVQNTKIKLIRNWSSEKHKFLSHPYCKISISCPPAGLPGSALQNLLKKLQVQWNKKNWQITSRILKQHFCVSAKVWLFFTLLRLLTTKIAYNLTTLFIARIITLPFVPKSHKVTLK